VATKTPVPPAVDRASVLRALFASTIGSAIEWYDFYLYSTATTLVLAPLFFPIGSSGAGVMASFATYTAGFVARPVGGLLAGHFGDRIGRKSMLVLTIMVMGAATFLVGLLPTYDQIGILAPAILVFLRVLQGVGIGGEWGGGVLLAVENAPPGRRAWYSSWPLIGFPLGLMASTLSFAAVATLPTADLMGWGWRIPFLLSCLLVALGIYVRVGIVETPEFTAVKNGPGVSRIPLWDVLRGHPRAVLCGMSATLGVGSVVSYFTVFLPSSSYAADAGTRSSVLTGLVIGAAVQCVTVPVYTRWSDRRGRKPVMVWGFLVTAVTAVPAVGWLGSEDTVLTTTSYVLAMAVGHAAAYGNLAAFLIDAFPVRVRYSALALTYQLGATISSFLPLVATLVAGGPRATGATGWLFAGVVAVASLGVALMPRPGREVQPVSPPG